MLKTYFLIFRSEIKKNYNTIQVPSSIVAKGFQFTAFGFVHPFIPLTITVGYITGGSGIKGIEIDVEDAGAVVVEQFVISPVEIGKSPISFILFFLYTFINFIFVIFL